MNCIIQRDVRSEYIEMTENGNQKAMEFFGVRTEGSMSLRLFPVWAQALGIQGANLRGVNLPIDGKPETYRKAVQRLKRDPEVYGALVTSHKLSVVRAAGELIDQYTPASKLTGEVSALYKRGGELWGDAVDPENCGLAMADLLPPNWWSLNEEAGILVLGGGGACVALLVHVLQQTVNAPSFVQVVEKRADNLDHCARVAGQLDSGKTTVEFIHSSQPQVCDQLVSKLPPCSMVINATGMGKDLPGSPVTDAVRFPDGGVVWELNYRGERPFLHQARKQSEARSLIVADGWHYFLRGWSSVIGLVFNIPITQNRFKDFCAVTKKN